MKTSSQLVRENEILKRQNTALRAALIYVRDISQEQVKTEKRWNPGWLIQWTTEILERNAL